MELIATSKHGYREEGERFTLDGSLAEILLQKGCAIDANEVQTTKTINDEKIDSDSGGSPAKRGRKRTTDA